jgi:hypothetical protein
VDECAQAIIPRDKELRRLRGKAGFRLELFHPRHRDQRGANDPEQVHILPGDLTQCIVLSADNATIEWRLLRAPDRLVQAVVQIARHHTARQGKVVAVTKPLKPDGPRWVFRGGTANVFGVMTGSILDRKKGTLSVALKNLGEFNGHYSDAHIMDLNQAENVYRPDQPELRMGRPLPFVFPEAPAVVREALARLLP